MVNPDFRVQAALENSSAAPRNMYRDQPIVTPKVAHLKRVGLAVQYHVRGMDIP